MINIKVESKDKSLIEFLVNHIESDILSRYFISDFGLVGIGKINTIDEICSIEIECCNMKMLLIPVLLSNRTINQYTEHQDILITITPDSNNITKDICNMIYDQYIGYPEYLNDDIVLKNNGDNITIFISENVTKIPLFVFSKFYNISAK